MLEQRHVHTHSAAVASQLREEMTAPTACAIQFLVYDLKAGKETTKEKRWQLINGSERKREKE